MQCDSLDVDGAADITGNVTIADKIIHSGDTNTAIRFPAADTVAVETSAVRGYELLHQDKLVSVVPTMEPVVK